ncbi:MAG: metallophosphoesterase [Oscillospiraceae bacterium]|nr:metallophosphoesterase [Oscillospiraceae bacterium]
MIFFWAAVAALAAVLLWSNFYLQSSSMELPFERLPKSFDGFKIVQLADLHGRGRYGKNNARLIAEVKEEEPDIVVMSGDMLDDKDKTDDVLLSLAGQLAEDYPVYYVVGNHELRFTKARREAMLEKLRDVGVTVLDNQKVSLQKGGDSIDMFGLWFDLMFYERPSKKAARQNTDTYLFDKAKMERLIGERNGETFSLLLTHNPLYFDTYADWGADLTFSGHLHGGVVRLPFLGGMLSPDVTFFPRYNAGLYKQNGSTMVVSRGLGNGNPVPRFFSLPEVVTVTLHKV